MRETGDWALWSRELARKIAEGGEQYLIRQGQIGGVAGRRRRIARNFQVAPLW